MRSRIWLPILLAGALGTLVVSNAPAQGGRQKSVDVRRGGNGAEVVPDRYIVQLKPGVEPVEGARRLAERHGLRIRQVYRYALKGFAAVIPSVRLESLRQEPEVRLVEPDLVVHALGQLLPGGVNRIDADLNSVAKIDGLDERVDADIAIIDTGAGPHPDLNVVARTDCTVGDDIATTCIDDDGSNTVGVDDNGHGTHVAGRAAALDNDFGVVGVAPGARLWSVKVLNWFGSGYLSWVIAGIDWVAQHAGQIEAANMSLGWWGNSDAARTAIQNSVALGVVYVVAAGNDSLDVYGPDQIFGTGDEFEPASYPECATVSAVADTDGIAGGTGLATDSGPDDTLATFSNFSTNVVAENPVVSPGAAIDVAAPGVATLSTYLGGTYATLSGTSMAAPHVAGAVGLYIAAHGRAHTSSDVAFIRQQIIDRAQPQTAWGPASTGDPDINREGLVNVGDSPGPPPPAAPGGLAATPVSYRQIVLSWMDNADNEDGFKIERCTGVGCTNFALIAQLVPNSTSYSDTALAGLTTYAYRVRAFNGGGHSDYSNTSEAATPALPPPPAPTDLVSTRTTPNEIDLSWQYNSEIECEFSLERCVGSGCTNFAQIAWGGGTLGFDLWVVETTTYAYRVRAFNNAGISAYSNTIEVTTPAASEPPYGFPYALVAAAASPFHIDLTWVDYAMGETGYQIERCTGSGCTDFVQIAQVLRFYTSYSDEGLAPSTTYAYRVRAFNSAGTTGYSNTSEATTQPFITLTVSGTKQKGVKIAQLQWSGATSANVDIFRNRARIATIANGGSYADAIGKGGLATYSYQVCQAGTSWCSNQATITF